VLRGRDVIYVGRRPGTNPLGMAYDIGLRLPAHCTASGLAMLSTLEQPKVEELYLDRGELEQLTPRSISNVGELWPRLAATRKQGYAIDDEETALGMVCVGAAVRDDAGETVGAVAVSMPKGARSKAELARDADEVRHLAAGISQALGAP
jgi:DNA-binding IclR family transcriptional regulator